MLTFLSIIGVLTLIGLTIFQLLLIVGKPLGEYTQGGQHKVLSKAGRIIAAISILLYVVFALLLLSKAGVIDVISDPSLLNLGVWSITIFSILSIVA